MPRKSVDDFRPRGLRIGERIYSDKDIEQIISAAGGLPDSKIWHLQPNQDASDLERKLVRRHVALVERIESAAQNYLINSEFATRPTGKQLSDEFKRIAEAADRLLEALHVPEDGDVDQMPDALRFGGLQAFAGNEIDALGGDYRGRGAAGVLQDAISGVVQIRHWASAATTRHALRHATPRKDRNKGDQSLDQFIGDLADIWIEVFERSIATSVGAPGRSNEGEASGPFLHYMAACLDPVLCSDTPSIDALRSRVRRHLVPKPLGKSTSEKS